jgi:hypothetical protein
MFLALPTCGRGAAPESPGAGSQSGASMTAEPSKGERVLKHSDVAAMYDASPEVCRAFSVSIIGWGGRPGDDAQVESFREQTIEPLHRIGVRHVGSVGMVTEFGRFVDQCPEWEQAICLTPRGERLRVPWLWDHSHEGNPAYWFCANVRQRVACNCDLADTEEAQTELSQREDADGELADGDDPSGRNHPPPWPVPE